MKNLKNSLKKLWKDESAQGATEYILLLVVVVGLVMMFGPRIKETVSNKLSELTGNISSFQGGN
jgi:Flp pilus assembly pilin Flp